ncbi:hypothetical protein LOTGIDRAFT_161508 [Lottia gigantea]|uniref:2'-5'-oligoadenylate synthetase 1 domain-containing protein n=1 Tax=Lottia gigantea TaxID=225164 RepID=V4AGJ3_LOTGI|nr:hypothetical protein LOTGIDRAFT_161508 [Lottia gigantea]ESO94285.1 hypothetical protein LOTGIDRAFT_161508 [Lottia gigantea]
MPSRYLPDLQPGESLETFIDGHLRPPRQFKEAMLKSVDTVVKYLHQLSTKYRHYNIKEIVKSGSLGKGTSYGETADVDLVVFFNGYKTMNSFLQDKPNIIRDIKWYMCNSDPDSWRFFGWLRPSYRPKWIDSIRVVRTTDYHVEFEATINFNGKLVTVHLDILPTIDIIDMHNGVNSVNKEIESQPPNIRGHYSVCFCKRQKLLYDGGMAKVKDLIRLLKYWKKKNRLNLKSYACEVLALWVYRNRLNENKSFKMVTGFTEALEILASNQSDEIVPSYTGIKSEYLDCFHDPTNPYSPTITDWGFQEIIDCADRTLRSVDNIDEGEQAMNHIGVTYQSELYWYYFITRTMLTLHISQNYIGVTSTQELYRWYFFTKTMLDVKYPPELCR